MYQVWHYRIKQYVVIYWGLALYIWLKKNKKNQSSLLIDYITWTKANFEKKESNQTKRDFFQNWINKQASLFSFGDIGKNHVM